MSLADNLANMIKDIFFIELLTTEERNSTVDDNLVDEFDNTKKCGINLVDREMNFNDN